jgi:hypothetical protein
LPELKAAGLVVNEMEYIVAYSKTSCMYILSYECTAKTIKYPRNKSGNPQKKIQGARIKECERYPSQPTSCNMPNMLGRNDGHTSVD